MAIATMIDAISTVNRRLEVMIVNMFSALITPEPTQEVKHLSLTSQASENLAGNQEGGTMRMFFIGLLAKNLWLVENRFCRAISFFKAQAKEKALMDSFIRDGLYDLARDWANQGVLGESYVNDAVAKREATQSAAN